MAHAAGSDLIRLAFIGCGGRGGGAVTQALSTAGPVKLVAMADVFADRIEDSLKYLLRIDAIRRRIDVPPERRFVGFDAYQKAIDCGVDMVILTTPPHFRPIHYAAAVKAGKHVYMEKPLAVDAPGVRAVEEANLLAKKKGLKVAVGFQRRHEADCRDALRRIRDGQIGPVRLIRTLLPHGRSDGRPHRQPGETEMEYQLRHWLVFHLAVGRSFRRAVGARGRRGQLGRQRAAAPGPGGRRPASSRGQGHRPDLRSRRGRIRVSRQLPHHRLRPANCRLLQLPGAARARDEGRFDIGRRGGGPAGQGAAEVQSLSVAARPAVCGDPPRRAVLRGRLWGQQHHGGDHGPDGLYSGKEVTWAQAIESKLSLAPARYALDADPPVLPDKNGYYPVAVPGMTVAW